MAFVSALIGIIWLPVLATGLPTVLLRWLAIPGAGHAGAHLLLPTAFTFPRPGAVIAQVIGVLIGVQIGLGIFRLIWLYLHCLPSTRRRPGLHPGRFVAGGSPSGHGSRRVPSVLVSRFLTGAPTVLIACLSPVLSINRG